MVILVAVQTLDSVCGVAKAWAAGGSGPATWITEWDTEADLRPVLDKTCGTVWVRDVKIDEAPAARSATKSPSLSVTLHRTDAISKAIEVLKQRPRRCLWGPIIHNDTPTGFDAQFGSRLLAQGKSLARRLCRMAPSQGWRALQVDLESLQASDADAYELFLRELSNCMRASGVRVSVAVHAKDPDHSTAGHIGEFQRFSEIAKMPVDVVLMAYDFSWMTSPPGPVAPRDWVIKVVRHAAAALSPGRLIVALPNYGYHWKRKDVGSPWTGKSILPHEARPIVQGWSPVPLQIADGYQFSKGDTEGVAWDDVNSLVPKIRALQAAGLAHPIAIWRAAGLTPEGIKQLESLK